jgi:hypothetical protein
MSHREGNDNDEEDANNEEKDNTDYDDCKAGVEPCKREVCGSDAP